MDTQTVSKVFDELPIGGLLWVILGIVFIIFGIYSVIMLWHWKEYSTGKFTTVANMFTYLGVSLGLITLMLLSASWYSLS